jgi:hypothetical protein
VAPTPKPAAEPEQPTELQADPYETVGATAAWAAGGGAGRAANACKRRTSAATSRRKASTALRS